MTDDLRALALAAKDDDHMGDHAAAYVSDCPSCAFRAAASPDRILDMDRQLTECAEMAQMYAAALAERTALLDALDNLILDYDNSGGKAPSAPSHIAAAMAARALAPRRRWWQR